MSFFLKIEIRTKMPRIGMPGENQHELISMSFSFIPVSEKPRIMNKTDPRLPIAVLALLSRAAHCGLIK